jgi:hypothetical protein
MANGNTDLKQILETWKEDCQIDRMRLDEDSRKTPILHAKYLELLSTTKLMLRKAEQGYQVLLKDKWMYYNGKMDQDTIISKGWKDDPFDGLKVLKGDMDKFYEADEDIQKASLQIAYLKTIEDTLKEIIDNLKWRHQTIKNIIEWKRFESGG